MVVLVQEKPMTVDAAAQHLGCKTYDTALPQDWVNAFNDKTGLYPSGHFVWSYDGGSLFGFPRPLTVQGHVALRKFDTAEGTHYLTEDAPVLLIGA